MGPVDIGSMVFREVYKFSEFKRNILRKLNDNENKMIFVKFAVRCQYKVPIENGSYQDNQPDVGKLSRLCAKYQINILGSLPE